MLKGGAHLYVKWRPPMASVWCKGPRWKRAFGVTSEVLHAPLPSRPLMKIRYLCYDFEPDVRELVCEPVQFDRVAMWADPRERL
jgi:hypothetical protein